MLNPNNSIGAFLVGAFVMVYLFGIVTVQTYHYYRKYPGDPLGLKVLVASIWFILVGHSITVAIGLYTVSVVKFGETAAEALASFPLGFSSSVLFSGLVPPMAQGYFVYRIHVISKRTYISTFFWVVCFVRLVADLGMAVYAIKDRGSSHNLLHEFAWLIKAILLLGAVSDTLITLTMCYYLKRERFTALERTVRTLDRLMKYTIETGVFTSLTGLTVAICYWKVDNMAWFGVYLILAEVYANALLANLNARKSHSNTDEKDHVSRRLDFLANLQARNSSFQRDLYRLESHHSSKVVADLGSGAKTSDQASRMSLAPSVSPVQGIIITVCQETQVARDDHGTLGEHSAELLHLCS
ncbi:hypothetical protein BJ138DRAFT_798272 [Hygrophoropsis aurantiaca]|uniref:Uncharacterized protein n=1 Tax=Hygrophoropsis aurantiaca TaxID=72124 RepID=A0ACB8AGQ0_9AGAM|nr:hypothetical protein BJ138DRAFT_798272 [Hygrophoropsis aurantiaca]